LAAGSDFRRKKLKSGGKRIKQKCIISMKLKEFKAVGEKSNYLLVIHLYSIFHHIVLGVGGDIWFQDLDEKLILQERSKSFCIIKHPLLILCTVINNSVS
jgi:hypothetical protein